MQGRKTLRYFLAGRPPGHVVLQLVLALVGHVLGDVEGRAGEHVGDRQDAGPTQQVWVLITIIIEYTA